MTLKARLCLNPHKSFQTKLTHQDYLRERVSLCWTGASFHMTATFLICILRGLHTLLQLFFWEDHSLGSAWAGTFRSRQHPLYKRNFFFPGHCCPQNNQFTKLSSIERNCKWGMIHHSVPPKGFSVMRHVEALIDCERSVGRTNWVVSIHQCQRDYHKRIQVLTIWKIWEQVSELGKNSSLQPTLNRAFSSPVTVVLNTHTHTHTA